jgi:hypothetical protein
VWRESRPTHRLRPSYELHGQGADAGLPSEWPYNKLRVAGDYESRSVSRYCGCPHPSENKRDESAPPMDVADQVLASLSPPPERLAPLRPVRIPGVDHWWPGRRETVECPTIHPWIGRPPASPKRKSPQATGVVNRLNHHADYSADARPRLLTMARAVSYVARRVPCAFSRHVRRTIRDAAPSEHAIGRLRRPFQSASRVRGANRVLWSMSGTDGGGRCARAIAAERSARCGDGGRRRTPAAQDTGRTSP